jgi:precorrin-6A/cobalt-precorrin-6A reductase
VLPNGISHRIGGFGGPEGLAQYLNEEKIDVVVDATHPYATRMSANAALAASHVACPLLRFTRPPWAAGPGDRWTTVPTTAAAANAVGPKPRRVFLTVGRQDLEPFRAAPWHGYIIRSVDPPDGFSAPPGAEIIAARGPFSLDDEISLLRAKRVEIVVTKNSGGSATQAKLIAARHLGIAVVMVDRPSMAAPDAPSVHSLDAAMAWLSDHHSAHAAGASPARPSRTMP